MVSGKLYTVALWTGLTVTFTVARSTSNPETCASPTPTWGTYICCVACIFSTLLEVNVVHMYGACMTVLRIGEGGPSYKAKGYTGLGFGLCTESTASFLR